MFFQNREGKLKISYEFRTQDYLINSTVVPSMYYSVGVRHRDSSSFHYHQFVDNHLNLEDCYCNCRSYTVWNDCDHSMGKNLGRDGCTLFEVTTPAFAEGEWGKTHDVTGGSWYLLYTSYCYTSGMLSFPWTNSCGHKKMLRHTGNVMFQNLFSWASVEKWRPAQILDTRLSWHLKFSSCYTTSIVWHIKNNTTVFLFFFPVSVSYFYLFPACLPYCFPIPFVSPVIIPFPLPSSPSH
jgi:hypothetical protein